MQDHEAEQWRPFAQAARLLLSKDQRAKLEEIEAQWPKDRLRAHQESSGWRRAMLYAGYNGPLVERAPWLPEHQEMFALREDARDTLVFRLAGDRWEARGRWKGIGMVVPISSGEWAGLVTERLEARLLVGRRWGEVQVRKRPADLSSERSHSDLSVADLPGMVSTSASLAQHYGLSTSLMSASPLAGGSAFKDAMLSGSASIEAQWAAEGRSDKIPVEAWRSAEEEHRREVDRITRERIGDIVGGGFRLPHHLPMHHSQMAPIPLPSPVEPQSLDGLPETLPSSSPMDGHPLRVAVAMLLPHADGADLLALLRDAYPSMVGKTQSTVPLSRKKRCLALFADGAALLLAEIGAGRLRLDGLNPATLDRTALPASLPSLAQTGRASLSRYEDVVRFTTNGARVVDVGNAFHLVWNDVRVVPCGLDSVPAASLPVAEPSPAQTARRNWLKKDLAAASEEAAKAYLRDNARKPTQAELRPLIEARLPGVQYQRVTTAMRDLPDDMKRGKGERRS